MKKIRTAWALVKKSQWQEFGNLIVVNFRKWRIQNRQGAAFSYRLGGRRFVCAPGLVDSEDLYLHRKIDRTEIRILEAWLMPRDVAMDIGANMGLYSFAAADQVGPGGLVVAIEAAPRLVEKLKVARSLLHANCLQIENIAVGERNGKASFAVSAPDRHSDQQALCSGQAPAPIGTQIVEVDMERLDAVAQSHPRLENPDLIKMDIEGAEVMALKGCPERWFKLNGPLWILEINPAALKPFGAKPEEITERFSPESHERWLLPKYTMEGREEGAPRRLSESEEYLDAKFYNLIAVPRGVARKDAARKISDILDHKKRT